MMTLAVVIPEMAAQAMIRRYGADGGDPAGLTKGLTAFSGTVIGKGPRC
jgi:hypothetical protein